MLSSTTPEIAPDRAILINEAAAATGIPSRKINRLIDDGNLPRSVCVKVGHRRALRAFALPMVGFGASDGAMLSKGMRLEAMRRIGEFAMENWPQLRADPECAKPLRIKRGCIVVNLGEPVSGAMAGLNKWEDALRRVVRDPEIRGGLLVLRGTRIGVHEIADALHADGMEMVLEDFPSLCRRDVEAAALYAKAHPKTGRPRTSADPRRLVSEKTVGLTATSNRQPPAMLA